MSALLVMLTRHSMMVVIQRYSNDLKLLEVTSGIFLGIFFVLW